MQIEINDLLCATFIKEIGQTIRAVAAADNDRSASRTFADLAKAALPLLEKVFAPKQPQSEKLILEIAEWLKAPAEDNADDPEPRREPTDPEPTINPTND